MFIGRFTSLTYLSSYELTPVSVITVPLAYFIAGLANLASGFIDEASGDFADLEDDKASLFLLVDIFLDKTHAGLDARLSGLCNLMGALYALQ